MRPCTQGAEVFGLLLQLYEPHGASFIPPWRGHATGEEYIPGGRVPSLATYTKLRVGQSDSFKLSSLHGSRNEGCGVKIYSNI